MSDIFSHATVAGLRASVVSRRELAHGLVTLGFEAPRVARTTQPGQFVGVVPRIGEGDPMLRRPFSVYMTEGDTASIIVQVSGRGTALIAETKVGDELDVLGPLGKPWQIKSHPYETAVLVIGGVGVASMPMLTRALQLRETQIATYYGARTASYIASDGLVNINAATDDGSAGYKGTNIALLREHLEQGKLYKPKLFVCGPNGMMRAAQQLSREFDIPCEISLETEMACGIGICQGCPVVTDTATFETTGKRFRLVCMEGPSFDREAIDF